MIDQLDGKTAIMSMLAHPESDVKHQALLCVQKLMVHHWEYLSKVDDLAAGSEQGSGLVESKA